MKTISLIVPTYNVESYLDKCLGSLPADKEGLEVLVIIDGSKDGSRDIALYYQKKYPDVFKVIEKDNGHYGSCVNVGLSLANGKYVKILDAYDFYDPSFSEFISFLDQIDADVVISNSVIVDEENKEKHLIDYSFEPYSVSDVSTLLLRLDRDIPLIHHQELTYKLSLLKEIGYQQTEGISYTDLEWSSIPFIAVKSYAYFPKIVYRYLEGREGASVSAEYRKKNMWMENKVVLGLVEKYESIKDRVSSDNASVFKSFISSMIRHVYYHYMVKWPVFLDEKELESFDSKLLSISYELYQLVSDTKDGRKFGTFYYVNDFRRKKTRKQIKYYYYDLCMSINSKINKILNK